MTERPILFSASMVQALLAGTKTQTRRVVKITHRTPGLAACLEPADPAWVRTKPAAELCPYGKPGDRLWVRETWAWFGNERDPSEVLYRADGHTKLYDGYGGWRPSIHMPRWASRITLEVTDVRVERLQAISVDDLLAEGVRVRFSPDTGNLLLRHTGKLPPFDFLSAPSRSQVAEGRVPPEVELLRAEYAALWEQINGAGSWDANPWVWVIGFKRLP